MSYDDLDRIDELTWSNTDSGSVNWQSSFSLDNPQSVKYGNQDASKLIVSDYGNDRVVLYDRTRNNLKTINQYKGTSTLGDETSYFNKPFSKGELQQAAFHLISSYNRRQQNHQARKMIEKLVQSYARQKELTRKLYENMLTEEQLQKVIDWSKALS